MWIFYKEYKKMKVYDRAKPAYWIYNRSYYDYAARKRVNQYSVNLENTNDIIIFDDEFQSYSKNKFSFEDGLKDYAVLYFTKNSKFPRFKLSDTTYKRCIKKEKADCIITAIDKNFYSRHVDCLIETKDAYYLSYSQISSHEICELLKITPGDYTIQKDITYYSDLNQDQLMYLNIMSGKITKPVMLDETLNKIIDSKNQILSKEDADQLYTMLSCSDSDTVGLGLKLMTNYNLSETPVTAKFLLYSTYNSWKYNSAKNNVAIKNMFKNLSFVGYEYNFVGLLNMCKNNSTKPNKVDLDIVNTMIIPVAQKHIKELLHYSLEALTQYGISVDVNVYKNE